MKHFLLIFFWTYLEARAQSSLTLNDFLKEVKQKNKSFEASNKNIEFQESLESSLDLEFAISAQASLKLFTDNKEQVNKGMMGNQTNGLNLDSSIYKKTESGFKWKIGYDSNYINIVDSRPQMLPMPQYFETKPYGELSYDLGKDYQGDMSFYKREEVKTKIKTGSLSERYKQQKLLQEAESAYWQLSYAREKILIQEKSLEQAKKLKSWMDERWQMHLSDKSDVLAVETAHKLRQLELVQAQLEEKEAKQKFNLVREIPGDQVNDRLDRFDAKNILHWKFQDSKAKRLDIQMQELDICTNEWSQKLKDKEWDPQVEIFVRGEMNGKDKNIWTAEKESLTFFRPTFAVGIKWSMMLDRDLAEKQRFSNALSVSSKKIELERKTFEADKEKDDLIEKIEHIKLVIKLSLEMVDTSKRKLDHERKIHKDGRSTTAQVLSLEQEYLQSQAALLGGLLKATMMRTQLRIYEESQS